MPKSTPSPTNSTKKAIDIRLNEPTIASPIAAVAASPTIRLKKTDRMIFHERSASHRMIRTPSTAASVSRTALCLMTENCSSFIGTRPVRSIVAPNLPRRSRSAAARRIPSVAFCPGWSWEKSSAGCTTQLVRTQLVALQQLFPRERRGLPGKDVLQGSVGKRKRPAELLQLEFASANAFGGKGQRFHHASQARIAGQGSHHGQRLHQALGAFPDLCWRAKQKPVALEKFAAVRLSDKRKQVRLLRQALGQSIGRQFGIFRGRRFDHHRNAFLGKRPGHFDLPLVPRQILGDQA